MTIQKLKDLLNINNHVLIDYTEEFINIECMDSAYNIYLLIDDKTKKKNIIILFFY